VPEASIGNVPPTADDLVDTDAQPVVRHWSNYPSGLGAVCSTSHIANSCQQLEVARLACDNVQNYRPDRECSCMYDDAQSARLAKRSMVGTACAEHDRKRSYRGGQILSPWKGTIMNTRLAAIAFTAGALLLPMTALAADANRDPDRDPPTTAKQFVKDSVITTKIKSDLMTAGVPNGLPSIVHISVDTDDKGAVTLSGSAESQKAVDRAGSIARAVKGVTSVENLVRVYP
jgi:hyperosmotically inducible protein